MPSETVKIGVSLPKEKFSVVILLCNLAFGIVTKESQLITHLRGSPSLGPTLTSAGMLRILVVTGATIIKARTW